MSLPFLALKTCSPGILQQPLSEISLKIEAAMMDGKEAIDALITRFVQDPVMQRKLLAYRTKEDFLHAQETLRQDLEDAFKFHTPVPFCSATASLIHYRATLRSVALKLAHECSSIAKNVENRSAERERMFDQNTLKTRGSRSPQRALL